MKWWYARHRKEKKKKKKSPTERNASCKDKKGNRTKCIGDTEPTKEPNPQPTAADQFISPHNACKFYNTGQIEKKKKISSRQLHAGIFLWFFFQYTLVVFPALYTRGRTSGSACFGLNETTFKKFHKDVMHLRYSITLKGSKKKEKDRAKHINYALHNGQENERHYTQLAVT